MYLDLDDPLTSLMVVLYNFVPALLPILPGLAIAFLSRNLLLKHQSNSVPIATDGACVAAEILEREGVHDWHIVSAVPPLATFCDPWRREIRLEETIFSGCTSWSVGVAAQQASLAVQASRYPWLAQFRALGLIAVKLGCLVAWLCVGAGLVMLSATLCLKGSTLYSALVIALLVLQRLDTLAVRNVRKEKEAEGIMTDLSPASPVGRAFLVSSWRELAAAWPVNLSRIRRGRRLQRPSAS